MLNSLAVVHHQKLFFKISSPRICLRNSKTLKQALRLNATDRHVRHWAPSEQHQHDYSSRSNKKNTKVSPKGQRLAARLCALYIDYINLRHVPFLRLQDSLDSAGNKLTFPSPRRDAQMCHRAFVVKFQSYRRLAIRYQVPIHNSCENWTAARATSLRYPRMTAIIKEYVGFAALSAFVYDFMYVLFQKLDM